MAFLTGLDEVLRERGVKVKTHPGWKTRGYLGMSFTEVRGTLWHHTATNRARFVGNDAPTLELCMHGRADLAGPLCQIVLGRDGTAHVIAAGWGNHAGYGSYRGIPANQGNAYLIGVEMESSGLPPYDWTPAQLAAIPVLRDALRDGYGHKLDIGHMEWSSQGKIDPAGLPGGMNWLRTAKANITAAASGTIAPAKPADPLEEIMSYYKNKQEFREDLAGLIKKYTVRATFRDMFDKRDTNVAQALRAIEKITRETREIAEASAKKAGLTTAEIAAAAERGAAKGAAEALADGVDIDVTINGKEIK